MKTIFNKNLLRVLKGEFQRAVRYKVLVIGIAVSLLWLIIIFFIRDNVDELSSIIPLLIFTDAAVMSVLLIGASIYFEKQEGSVRSILVAPVNVWQILIAKLVNSIFISIISALIVGVGAILIAGITINILLLIVYVIITVTAHAAIGLAIAMVSKDFNSMMINFMAFVFIFIMPPILILLNVIPAKYEMIVLISPSEAANILLHSSLSGVSYEWYKIVIAIVYLLAITFVLMKFFVHKRFVKDAMRG